MVTAQTVLETSIDGLELVHRGKVRDVYQVSEERLLLVATDRLSAFDSVLPTPIKYKGIVLTKLSAFWFKKLEKIVDHHMITAEFDEMPDAVRRHEELRGRSMLVKKAKVFPVECVVRGYLEGSGWKDYKASKGVCGHKLPPGLQHCDRLLLPIFTALVSSLRVAACSFESKVVLIVRPPWLMFLRRSAGVLPSTAICGDFWRYSIM